MTSILKNLLGTAKLAVVGPSDGITPCESLFPKVNPALDGEDCEHDCDSCHIKYPKGFKIDEDDKLYGHVKEWSTHVLIATGKTDWVRDVADEKGSLMEAIDKKANVKPTNGVSRSRTLLDLVLTFAIEIDALGFKYTYSVALDRLL